MIILLYKAIALSASGTLEITFKKKTIWTYYNSGHPNKL